jgi:hypothetical protein
MLPSTKDIIAYIMESGLESPPTTNKAKINQAQGQITPSFN